MMMMIMQVEDEQKWPPWLKPLLRESFFVQCKLHADSHNSECNMYCLDCVNGALCFVCLRLHEDHCVIQFDFCFVSVISLTMGVTKLVSSSVPWIIIDGFTDELH
ncbi:putative transcription factor interactor and regulator Znf-B family [Helianthus anomalus]